MRLFVRSMLAFAIANLALELTGCAARAEHAIVPATQLGGRGAEANVADAAIELAQGYGAPPADVGDPDERFYNRPQQDAAGLLVRIDRLENQLRKLNGQVEQLQFQNRKLEEELKKFQEDVDFRFQDSGGNAGPSASPAAKPLQKRTESLENLIESDNPTASGAPAQAPMSTPTRTRQRDDAFDPSADPNAPGAPRMLGNPIAPQGNAAAAGSNMARAARSDAVGLDPNDPDAPLDLSNGKFRGGQPASSAPPTGARPTPTAAPPAPMPPNGAAAADSAVNPAKEQFDLALGYYRQREYENAEMTFAAFLKKNPKNKMAPDATYYLGESYFQRGRQREAAEQYLKVSTQYANSTRAPDAMLRLGQSLYALGAKEQACATFGEIPRKYPNASATVKTGAEREGKRAQC